jgi:peptidoglycan/xylan/chitin deacetylase (PgdA/CDA1 family)
MSEARLTTFLFHKLGAPRHSGDVYSLPPPRFAAFLELAVSHASNFICLSQLPSALPQTGRHRVAITFDDGYESDYSRALPLLAQYDLTATFFIVPTWIGKPDYLSWKQVRALSEAGMVIGSHTLTHPWLPELSQEMLCEELLGSRLEIEDRIGSSVKSLSLPGGYYTRPVLSAARKAGYLVVCTSDYGIDSLAPDTWVLKRNSVDLRSSWSLIEELLQGHAPFPFLAKNWVKRLISRAIGPSTYKRLSDSWRRN